MYSVTCPEHRLLVFPNLLSNLLAQFPFAPVFLYEISRRCPPKTGDNRNRFAHGSQPTQIPANNPRVSLESSSVQAELPSRNRELLQDVCTECANDKSPPSNLPPQLFNAPSSSVIVHVLIPSVPKSRAMIFPTCPLPDAKQNRTGHYGK